MSDEIISQTRQGESSAINILSQLYSAELTEKSRCYFEITGKNILGTLSGLVAVNQVMDNIYPDKNIDWEQVPASYLQMLFSQHLSQLLFPFSKEPMQLQVDNVYLGEKKPASYPLVKTEIGDVFIFDLTGKYEWISLTENKLSVRANFYIGFSKISLSLLKTISSGDLLLIDTLSYSFNIGGKKWHSFQWAEDNTVELSENSEDKADIDTAENSVIEEDRALTEHSDNTDNTEDVEETNNIATDDPLLAENINLKSISSIPITVSFLLASKILSIEEIEQLAPGKQLTLPENAARNITLTVNGMAIAQGELIKVGERLAVEIHHSDAKFG